MTIGDVAFHIDPNPPTSPEPVDVGQDSKAKKPMWCQRIEAVSTVDQDSSCWTMRGQMVEDERESDRITSQNCEVKGFWMAYVIRSDHNRMIDVSIRGFKDLRGRGNLVRQKYYKRLLKRLREYDKGGYIGVGRARLEQGKGKGAGDGAAEMEKDGWEAKVKVKNIFHRWVESVVRTTWIEEMRLIRRKMPKSQCVREHDSARRRFGSRSNVSRKLAQLTHSNPAIVADREIGGHRRLARSRSKMVRHNIKRNVVVIIHLTGGVLAFLRSRRPARASGERELQHFGNREIGRGKELEFKLLGIRK
ncbi:hypothetical protein C8R45DRAFT_933849 [Mycena sanguinolenta]|nr:hypothetical protein C8R45DRAFT_933849 [Mycena sanguinolenta]